MSHSAGMSCGQSGNPTDGEEHLEADPVEGATASVDTCGGKAPYLKVTD